MLIMVTKTEAKLEPKQPERRRISMEEELEGWMKES